MADAPSPGLSRPGVTLARAPHPHTATGSQSDRNYDGQVIAITVFTTVRPWRNLAFPIPGNIFLPLLYAVAARIPPLTNTLRRLSFIHFARWSLIRELPYNGPPQRKGRLQYTHMYFESNFNGGWEEYIDAFSHILTRGMTIFWGSCFGYPKPLPTAPFKAYIQQQEVPAAHYYCAYPEATATTVQAALKLQDRLTEFRSRSATLSAPAFAEAYAALLTETQEWL